MFHKQKQVAIEIVPHGEREPNKQFYLHSPLAESVLQSRKHVEHWWLLNAFVQLSQ